MRATIRPISRKKAKRFAQEAREDAARQKALEREQEWIAASPKARQAKSKARIKAYDELLRANEERLRSTSAQIVIPPGERLGNTVIEVESLSKGYGDRLLIEDLNFKLPPGGIVGVIGPNGAGKTTLFRMLTGQEKPDRGAIRIGDSVNLGYVDQSRDALDPDKTVWEEISGGNDVLSARQARGQFARLHRRLQLQGRRPAAEGRHAVGRPAQPRASRQDAEVGRQCAAARRADQRSRHRDAGGARRGARGLRRLRASSSATTACSSTGSPPTSSPSRATAMSNGSRAISPDYEEDKKRRLGEDSVMPKRIKYKQFAR